MELLERLLEIVGTQAFAAIYDDIAAAIAYDTGDADDARLILEAMNDSAAGLGFDNAASLVAHVRGEHQATTPAA